MACNTQELLLDKDRLTGMGRAVIERAVQIGHRIPYDTIQHSHYSYIDTIQYINCSYIDTCKYPNQGMYVFVTLHTGVHHTSHLISHLTPCALIPSIPPLHPRRIPPPRQSLYSGSPSTKIAAFCLRFLIPWNLGRRTRHRTGPT